MHRYAHVTLKLVRRLSEISFHHGEISRDDSLLYAIKILSTELKVVLFSRTQSTFVLIVYLKTFPPLPHRIRRRRLWIGYGGCYASQIAGVCTGDFGIE